MANTAECFFFISEYTFYYSYCFKLRRACGFQISYVLLASLPTKSQYFTVTSLQMPPKRILPSALGLKKKKKKREKKKKKGETKTTVQTKASEEEAGAAAAVDSSRTVVLPHINNSSRCESQSIPSVPAEVHAEVKSLLARSKFEGSALRFALNAMRQENDKLKSALSILKEKYVQGVGGGTLFYSFCLHEPLIQLPSAHRSFRPFKRYTATNASRQTLLQSGASIALCVCRPPAVASPPSFRRLTLLIIKL